MPVTRTINQAIRSQRMPARDERGLSITPFVSVIFAALILTAGLVIDGGQKVTAASRAEVAAARHYLAGQPGVTGSVTINAGVVEVSTRTTEPTILLSAIGIDAVTGTG